MSGGATVTFKVHLTRGPNARRHLREGEAPPKPHSPEGRTPHLSKLMALAIKFDGLIRSGVIRRQSELARAGRVTSARVSQIMGLNYLAPSIQEEILFLPRVTRGRSQLTEQAVRPIACMPDWAHQRRAWAKLKDENDGCPPKPKRAVTAVRDASCGKIVRPLSDP
jgi:hypothetical protein